MTGPRTTTPWDAWVGETLERRREADLLRGLRPVEPVDAVRVRADGRDLVLFSGNDYLGLSHHPAVRRAVARAAREVGNGPRGSALVCGHTTDHDELARDLADLKEAEAGLLFPTGYAANLATIGALAGEGCTIFSDELNHASIIDGVRLARRAGADLAVYGHRDVEHLAELLETAEADRVLVVTDAVFSMDGDRAPLREIADLTRRHGALLLVDEAHATFVFGEGGAGLAEALGVQDGIDIHLGTLSKAAGANGGFIATSHPIRDLVLNRGRAFIYSTALTVPVVRGLRAALEVATTDPEPRERLRRHERRVADRLGIEVESPIVPVVLGDEEKALEASERLFAAGYHVPAIRPPTVPEGTARLRVALSAAHAEEEVEGLLDVLETLDFRR